MQSQPNIAYPICGDCYLRVSLRVCFVQGSGAACHTLCLFHPKIQMTVLTKHYTNSHNTKYTLFRLSSCRCIQCWSTHMIIKKLPLLAPYLQLILYPYFHHYSLFVPTVLPLLYFSKVLFYCFWLQVHCTYLSHQNKCVTTFVYTDILHHILSLSLESSNVRVQIHLFTSLEY